MVFAGPQWADTAFRVDPRGVVHTGQRPAAPGPRTEGSPFGHVLLRPVGLKCHSALANLFSTEESTAVRVCSFRTPSWLQLAHRRAEAQATCPSRHRDRPGSRAPVSSVHRVTSHRSTSVTSRGGGPWPDLIRLIVPKPRPQSSPRRAGCHGPSPWPIWRASTCRRGDRPVGPTSSVGASRFGDLGADNDHRGGLARLADDRPADASVDHCRVCRRGRLLQRGRHRRLSPAVGAHQICRRDRDSRSRAPRDQGATGDSGSCTSTSPSRVQHLWLLGVIAAVAMSLAGSLLGRQLTR